MMSGKPLQSILLSVGARALFGLAAGYLYRAVRRSRHPYIGIFLVASVGSRLHAFLVYGFMEFLFPAVAITQIQAVSNGFVTNSIISEENMYRECEKSYWTGVKARDGGYTQIRQEKTTLL